MNIALLLEMAADAAGDRVGLVCDGKRWTYGELLAAARGAAELIADSKASVNNDFRILVGTEWLGSYNITFQPPMPST